MKRTEIRGVCEMPHDVFISYSSLDKPTADAICARLELCGIQCWIAPRDILPGLSYGEALSDSLSRSHILLLVFSANSNRSSHVMREVESAVHKGIAILPFRIEDVKPTASLEYFVKSIQWLDAINPPMEMHLQTLVGTIQLLLERRNLGPITLGMQSPFETVTPAGTAARGVRRSDPLAKGFRGSPWIVSAGILMVAAALATIGFALWRANKLEDDGSLRPTVSTAAVDSAAEHAASAKSREAHSQAKAEAFTTGETCLIWLMYNAMAIAVKSPIAEKPGDDPRTNDNLRNQATLEETMRNLRSHMKKLQLPEGIWQSQLAKKVHSTDEIVIWRSKLVGAIREKWGDEIATCHSFGSIWAGMTIALNVAIAKNNHPPDEAGLAALAELRGLGYSAKMPQEFIDCINKIELQWKAGSPTQAKETHQILVDRIKNSPGIESLLRRPAAKPPTD